MMGKRRIVRAATLCILLGITALASGRSGEGKNPPSPLATGLDRPHAVTVADDGTTFVADRTGIRKVVNGQAQAFSTEPAVAIQAGKQVLYACTRHELKRIDSQGKAGVLIAADKFRDLARGDCTLTGVTANETGSLFVTAVTGKKEGCVFRISPQGRLNLDVPPGKAPELKHPVAVTVAGETALLVQNDQEPRALLLCLLQKKVLGHVPLGTAVGLAYDHHGRAYGADAATNTVQVVVRPGHPTHAFPNPFKDLTALTFDPVGNRLLALDAGAGTLVALPPGDPQEPIDESPLPAATTPAFPKIQWANWQPENDRGVLVPHRPVVLTHAHDQSGRTFVATQHGVIHVFPNRPDVTRTKVFLDLQDRVIYDDRKNEEGFLGLAFHPKYRENGQFFVYYTKKPGLISVISRFRVSKDDPDRADPAEEVLLTFKQPFWNHNGGTIVFGPDGFLYVGLGDGGAANDPYRHGQNLGTLLGSILRLDVDRKEGDKAYAIPKDNPFVNTPNARPEIYAYGLRNVWRMAFDHETGQGWVADVGQNLYEEINLLHRGGNYGWNPRESFHPFGDRAVDVNDRMIEPIWEYHHRVGKSITGGHVYRGRQLPELRGKYLYADYVSSKIWALTYDFTAKRVTANQEIANRNLPVLSFGEDEQGESYLLTVSASGQGIYRLVKKESPTSSTPSTR